MNDLYTKILDLALPYYEIGRSGDVEHIRWLYEVVLKFLKNTDLDEEIVMPVLLLHDVGYSQVPKDADPFKLDIRTLHSKKGADIAEEILRKLAYPQDKIREVKRLIRKHDNWAFGDSFSEEPVLQFFNNFDFMWMASPKGFSIVRGFMNKDAQEFYEQIKEFQDINEKEGRDWYTQEIKEYYEELMRQRKKELVDE